MYQLLIQVNDDGSSFVERLDGKKLAISAGTRFDAINTGRFVDVIDRLLNGDKRTARVNHEREMPDRIAADRQSGYRDGVSAALGILAELWDQNRDQGGEIVHQAWYQGVTYAGGEVAEDRRVYERLSVDDKRLDRHIARIVLQQAAAYIRHRIEGESFIHNEPSPFGLHVHDTQAGSSPFNAADIQAEPDIRRVPLSDLRTIKRTTPDEFDILNAEAKGYESGFKEGSTYMLVHDLAKKDEKIAELGRKIARMGQSRRDKLKHAQRELSEARAVNKRRKEQNDYLAAAVRAAEARNRDYAAALNKAEGERTYLQEQNGAAQRTLADYANLIASLRSEVAGLEGDLSAVKIGRDIAKNAADALTNTLEARENELRETKAALQAARVNAAE